jgi:hypothetical protein
MLSSSAAPNEMNTVHATKNIFEWPNRNLNGTINPYRVLPLLPKGLTERTEFTIVNTDGQQVPFVWEPGTDDVKA